MKVLFIHQSLPGQFRNLAPRLAEDAGNEVWFITKQAKHKLRGVRQVQYKIPDQKRETHPYMRSLQSAVLHGQYVAQTLAELKRRRGFRPDIVYAHPGWGEAFFVKDVWPGVPLLNYCEFFYHAFGADANFDPREKVNADSAFKIRTRNSVHLLNLAACDWGISPTEWQCRQHPPEYRRKITVLHDGIDTARAAPDPAATLELPGGRVLTARDEVVTYVTRNLEPYRGFPSFLEAAKLLSERRPDCQFVLLGGDGVSYGAHPAGGRTFREIFCERIKIDPQRIHFLGTVPYAQFLRVLQVSSAHVYLTVPFVLSWSMLEAMSACCLVVGSNTPPVAEVIEDGYNGLLADFFSPEEIAERVQEALDNRERMAAIRKRARDTIVERYDLRRCLPAQIRLLTDIVAGRMPPLRDDEDAAAGASVAVEQPVGAA